MPFGFEHGDSWFDLVWTLCERLETVVAAAETKTGRSFHVHQVKEKFGGLRFNPITAMTPSPLSLKLPGLSLFTPARTVPAPASDAAPIGLKAGATNTRMHLESAFSFQTPSSIQ
jgi:hypothetical protein